MCGAGMNPADVSPADVSPAGSSVSAPPGLHSPGAHGEADRGAPGHVAALAALDLMGPSRLRAVLRAASAQSVWNALLDGALPVDGELPRSGATPELFDRAGPVVATGAEGLDPSIDGRLALRWGRQARSNPELPEVMGGRLRRLGVRVATGALVPQRLAADEDAPAALFVSGRELPPLNARVAIVGTRKASQYGLRVAHQLGRELAAAGVEVVSGLALGIDAAAHAGALETLREHPATGGGPGITAVIGAGHDRPCPSRNRSLARSVVRAGTMLSEVPPGAVSAPWRYPVRNRLIAALADVVVVVESEVSGGSMSTVAEALSRDRPVMAVPGPLGSSTSEGCHRLLRDGAQICTGAGDVIGMLDLLGAQTTTGPQPSHRGASGAGAPVGSGAESTLLDLLAAQSCDVGTLADRAGLDIMEVSAALVRLESASRITRRSGWIERI